MLKSKKHVHLIVVAGLIVLAGVLATLSTQMQAQKNGFSWNPYDPAVLKRLIDQEDKPSKKGGHASLDIILVPQHDDAKLRESTFLISIFNPDVESTIYRGPFKDRIVIPSAPHSDKMVEISFWAFHEDSKMFLSWRSLNLWPIFETQPLSIELYSEYRADVDGWFDVRPLRAR